MLAGKLQESKFEFLLYTGTPKIFNEVSIQPLIHYNTYGMQTCKQKV